MIETEVGHAISVVELAVIYGIVVPGALITAWFIRRWLKKNHYYD